MRRVRKNLELERNATWRVQVSRPISVVTLEKEGVKKMHYAPSSLYWDLKNRSETNSIKYDGTQPCAKGYEYPVFRFAK